MSRGYSVTTPGQHRVLMNGAVLSNSTPTSRIENLGRAAVIKGQTDIYDGFKYPNPYWMQYLLDDRPYGTWKVSSFGRQYEYQFSLGPVVNFVRWPHRMLPEVSIRAENDAIIKALEKLKDQKVNLRVAMAEAGDVADMIAENASRIANGLRHLKKGRWRKAYKAIRHTPRKGYDTELASRVLEFQYGVRPLVSDIHGAMEALANSRYGPKRCGMPFKVVGTVKGGSKETNIGWSHNDIGYLPVTGSTRNYWEVKVVLWYSPKNEFLKTMSELGFTNPAVSIWEKLPFSCVVDWAWPVSDWLNTLDAATGLEFRGGTCTTWRQTESTYAGNKTSNNGISSVVGNYRERSMVRTVYPTSPIPSPPSVKNPAGVEHALNALSLMTSIFRG